jgi:dienelactone hydrolase
MARNLFENSDGERKRWEDERHELVVREISDLLENLMVDEYADRQDDLWNRDYSSIESYLTSVEPNRQRWRDTLGDWGSPETLDAETSQVMADDIVNGVEVAVPVIEGQRHRARAVLGKPATEDGPYPVVVACHGAGSSPEKIFGLGDTGNNYRAFGRRLVDAGYAVLAPRFINAGGDRGGEARRKLEVFSQSLGRSLFGLEAHQISCFVDWMEGRPSLDTDRIGAWGVSMGGALVLFTLPIEDRIDASICAGFFTDRLVKHGLEEPRYSHFRPVSEMVHFFIPGWFREFRDADLTSLICPRPFQVQAGLADTIDWRPYTRREFERAREHYERLGVPERIDFCAHDGGHEARPEEGITFLDEHVR